MRYPKTFLASIAAQASYFLAMLQPFLWIAPPDCRCISKNDYKTVLLNKALTVSSIRADDSISKNDKIHVFPVTILLEGEDLEYCPEAIPLRHKITHSEFGLSPELEIVLQHIHVAPFVCADIASNGSFLKASVHEEHLTSNEKNRVARHIEKTWKLSKFDAEYHDIMPGKYAFGLKFSPKRSVRIPIN